MTVDVLPWTTEKLGLGRGRKRLTEPLAPTLEELLDRMADRIPGFVEWVYDRPERRIHEHCTLLLNGLAIEAQGGLAAKLKAGDELTVLPGFSGG